MENIQQVLYFTPALPCMACNTRQTNHGDAFTAESQGLEERWFNGAWVLFPICERVECKAKMRELMEAFRAQRTEKEGV